MRGNILFMVLFPHISLHSSFCQRCRSFSSLPLLCLVRTHGLEFAWRTAHFPVKLVFYKSQTLRRNWRTPLFERISLYKWGPRALLTVTIRLGKRANVPAFWTETTTLLFLCSPFCTFFLNPFPFPFKHVPWLALLSSHSLCLSHLLNAILQIPLLSPVHCFGV